MGESRSHFTENKTVLSQFTKNKDNENHSSRRLFRVAISEVYSNLIVTAWSDLNVGHT